MLKRGVFFLSVLSFLFLLYFLFNSFLGSNYLYPDSFYYIASARYNWGVNIKSDLGASFYIVDFFTLLKPLASYAVSIIYFFRFAPGYINTFLLIFGLLMIWRSKTTHKIYSPFIMGFILVFVNGATWYFLNRYVSEFIIFALLSLIINAWYHKKNVFHIYYVIIVLLRPEWIICYPFFLIQKNAYRFPILEMSISSTYLVYAGFIAWQSNNVNLFFSHLLLPVILVWIGLFILQKNIFLWLKHLPFLLSKILLLGKFTIILSLLLYVLSLLTSYSIWFPMRGIVVSVLLMFPLWFSVVRSIDSSKLSKDKDKIAVGSIVLVTLTLTLIFWITARDSFRYYLIVTPLLLRLALFSNKNIYTNLKNKTMWLLWGLSTLIIILILPWDILTKNYWLDRFYLLKDMTAKENVVIISSTPIITFHIGYKSGDICDPSLSKISGQKQTKILLILDDYAHYKCPNKYLEWQELVRNKEKNIYQTDLQVEIERYRASSQISYFYLLESE